MTSEIPVRFDNFNILNDNVEDIGAVRTDDGATIEQGMGVFAQLRTAFNYEAQDFRGLIGAVAPHRELQKNIDHVVETFAQPEVKEKLGVDPSLTGFQVAKGICDASGLQTKVFRPVYASGLSLPHRFNVGLLPERVPNWMERMADLAISVGRKYDIDELNLISSTREIGPDEKPGVEAGTPSEDYMQDKLETRLKAGQIRGEDLINSGKVFDKVSLTKTGEKTGEIAMQKAVERLVDSGLDVRKAKVLVFSVAGNWVQSIAQARLAFKSIYPGFDSNEDPQIYVVCDEFPAGETGQEPKTTHQNPASAIGNVVRKGMYLDDLKNNI